MRRVPSPNAPALAIFRSPPCLAICTRSATSTAAIAALSRTASKPGESVVRKGEPRHGTRFQKGARGVLRDAEQAQSPPEA